MAIPNEVRKAIYICFLERIDGEYIICPLALRTPSDIFTGLTRAAAEAARDDPMGGISDTTPFDDNPNLAVILTFTDPDPGGTHFDARRLGVWTDVTDEVKVVTVLDRADPDRAHIVARITFDNEKFDEPPDGEWVRLAVRHTGRSQETLGAKGNRKFRSFGSVFVQVFTEAGERMLVADCIAQKIVEVFDDLTCIVPGVVPGSEPSALVFEAASSSEGGPEGKWNMVIVEAPFSYDDVK